MDVQIIGFPIPNWRYGGTVSYLRLYSSETWTDFDGVVHLAGIPGSLDGFYQEVVCSVAGTQVNVPNFFTPPTVNSPDMNIVKVTAVLFTEDNQVVAPYLWEDWAIPAISPLNWRDLTIANHGKQAPLGDCFVTMTQFLSTLAGAGGDANKNYSLYFSGTAGEMVDYGQFWPDPTIDLGPFFWEFLLAPEDGGEVVITDGPVMDRPCLLLAYASDGIKTTWQGDAFNGAVESVVQSLEGPALDEWAIIAFAWDGTQLIIYQNGVPIGAHLFAGPRKTVGAAGGAGNLLIGGSDKRNFKGFLQEFRGWENTNPVKTNDGTRIVPAPYRTDIHFTQDKFGLTQPIANLVSNFFRSNPIVTNLVGGGEVGRVIKVESFPGDPSLPFIEAGCPKYVLNEKAPLANPNAGIVPPTGLTRTPTTPPPGCKIFDSFERANSTLAFEHPAELGATEAGSLHPIPWQIGSPLTPEPAFGILNGRATPLLPRTGLAWVVNDSNIVDVAVDRGPLGTDAVSINTGLVFRVTDEKNFFCAYSYGTPTDFHLRIAKWIAGVETELANQVIATGWTTFKVQSDGGTGIIKVLLDGALSKQVTDAALGTAKGVGLWNQFTNGGYPSRYKNFIVY